MRLIWNVCVCFWVVSCDTVVVCRSVLFIFIDWKLQNILITYENVERARLFAMGERDADWMWCDVMWAKSIGVILPAVFVRAKRTPHWDEILFRNMSSPSLNADTYLPREGWGNVREKYVFNTYVILTEAPYVWHARMCVWRWTAVTRLPRVRVCSTQQNTQSSRRDSHTNTNCRHTMSGFFN